MKIDTTYYVRCIETLEKANEFLLNVDIETIEYDMYRSACVKEFEIIIELSSKLLRKVLKPYFHSSTAVDKLYFKDVFRHAVLRGIINSELCERFLVYRDTRNNTAHDYGVNFAEETLMLLPSFIEDSKQLALAIETQSDVTEE